MYTKPYDGFLAALLAQEVIDSITHDELCALGDIGDVGDVGENGHDHVVAIYQSVCAWFRDLHETDKPLRETPKPLIDPNAVIRDLDAGKDAARTAALAHSAASSAPVLALVPEDDAPVVEAPAADPVTEQPAAEAPAAEPVKEGEPEAPAVAPAAPVEAEQPTPAPETPAAPVVAAERSTEAGAE